MANPTSKGSKTISLEEGQIKLFLQKGSKKWKYHIKLAGEKRVPFSSGTANYDEAEKIPLWRHK